MADINDLPPWLQIGGGIGAALFTLVIAGKNFIKGATKPGSERIVLESADASDLNLMRGFMTQLKKNFDIDEDLLNETKEINQSFKIMLKRMEDDENRRRQEDALESMLARKGLKVVKANDPENK